MIIRGFIAGISKEREWTSKNGEVRQSVDLTISVPYVKRDGQKVEDVLLAEFVLPDTNHLEGLKQALENQEKCEFQIAFSLVDGKQNKFQKIKVYGLTKMI